MKTSNSKVLDFLPVTLTSILFISQIIIGLSLINSISQHQLLAYVGVAVYIIGGWIFGLMPICEFRRKGGVQQGSSYIHTTILVDTGLYAIVRHPQYLSWILFAIAGMLLFQHYIVIILGLPIIPLTYIDLLRADEQLQKKFGYAYTEYMHKVPRANIVLGIFRWIKRKKKISN